MGRWGDWAKGPWKDTIRVEVAYVVKRASGEEERYDIITVIHKKSHDYRRDAAERVRMKLSQTVKPPDLFRIVSTKLEGDIPLIHPKDSW